MLATAPYMSRAPYAFLPTIPSPLSPRSANIYGRRRSMASPVSGERPTQKTFKDNDVPFTERPVKKAPSAKQDELKERRRKMFLKKVTDRREDTRFENRGEDILRLDFVQRQRQWEEERAREAPPIPSDPPSDDDIDVPLSSGNVQFFEPSSQVPQPEDEVDEYLQQEDAELEALLSFMPLPGEEDDEIEKIQREDPDLDEHEFWQALQDLHAQAQEQMEDVPSGQQAAPDEAMDMS